MSKKTTVPEDQQENEHPDIQRIKALLGALRIKWNSTRPSGTSNKKRRIVQSYGKPKLIDFEVGFSDENKILFQINSRVKLGSSRPLLGPYLVSQLENTMWGIKAQEYLDAKDGSARGHQDGSGKAAMEGYVVVVEEGDPINWDSDEWKERVRTNYLDFKDKLDGIKLDTQTVRDFNAKYNIEQYRARILESDASPKSKGKNSFDPTDIKALLESNYQVILTGAPGTGKTFTAKQVAEAMITEGLSTDEEKKKAMDERFKSVQFHPGYDYSDFVVGMKPVLVSPGSGKEVFTRTDGSRYTTNNDKEDGKQEDFPKEGQSPQTEVSYKWKDGIFKKFADEARKNYGNLMICLLELFTEKKEFKTEGRKSRFTITEVNDKTIKIEIPDNKKSNNVDLEIEIIRKLFVNGDFKKAMDVSRYLGRPTLKTGNVNTRQEDSYYFALWQAIRQRIEEMKSSAQDKPYVFLIDEINRADLSRVFGELFSLLEEEYRYPNGKGTDSILLPNGERFSIPKNLYIIGTMNDIDRSVESMDFALRRRFAWKEVRATDTQKDILFAKNADGSPKIDPVFAGKLENAMNALNFEIAGEEVNGNKPTLDLRLGPEYELGGAIFAKFEKCNGDFNHLWKNHIQIILNEYLRGRSNRDTLLKEMEKTYYSKVSNNETRLADSKSSGDVTKYNELSDDELAKTCKQRHIVFTHYGKSHARVPRKEMIRRLQEDDKKSGGPIQDNTTPTVDRTTVSHDGGQDK